jgi:hypothetical protein
VITLEKWASALRELVGPPPRRSLGRECSPNHELLNRVKGHADKGPAARNHLCE